MKFLCFFLLLLSSTGSRGGSADQPVVSTYSIVAYDPQTKELAVAVQSKFIAVGAVVPWAKSGVGAVATQALANTTYGPEALALLAKGEKPSDVIKKLTDGDTGQEHRQIGIVSASGESATFTGNKCHSWAGGVAGENYACQGNILAGEEVVKAMQKSFLESKGDIGTRLLTALQAAQDAGGDVRGMQSAALLIVREGWGYAGLNDRFRDLRVDDHAEPIKELKRIYELHCALFPKPQH
ncbi:MAG TPA: DUF1028 domain-containing protein [Planctomycetota bacterium]|nr:DUF1028 domain-containing protein [Planctomycetota bacterium]